MNKKVSVIIPTHGRADFLDRAINSVINQTYNNVEVIIVDDNGKGTQAQIETEKVVKRYSGVIYIALKKNIGGGLARNEGVKIATGCFLTFLDDDDFYFPNKIESQLEHIINNSLKISLCDMDIVSESNDSFRHSSRYSQARGFTLKDFLFNGVAFTPMIMVEKSLFEKVGGFMDTPRFQDHTLMLRLLSATSSVGHLEKKLFVHSSSQADRISLSKKSRLGFIIRHRLENRIAKKLEIDRLSLRFNQKAQISPFIYKRSGYKKYLIFMLCSLKGNISLKNVLLTLYRVGRTWGKK